MYTIVQHTNTCTRLGLTGILNIIIFVSSKFSMLNSLYYFSYTNAVQNPDLNFEEGFLSVYNNETPGRGGGVYF